MKYYVRVDKKGTNILGECWYIFFTVEIEWPERAREVSEALKKAFPDPEFKVVVYTTITPKTQVLNGIVEENN